MEYRRFGNTLAVRLDRGEEITEQVLLLAEKEHIRLAEINALGAVNDFTVGVFDVPTKAFHGNHFEGVFEITSLHGTLTEMGGKPYLHLHMSAGDESGHVFGGHLKSARISATCEMIVRCIDGEVGRKYSDEIGLNLFAF